MAGSSNNYSSVSASEHVHENEHDRVIRQAAMVANAKAAASAHQDDRALAGSTSGDHHHQRRPSTHSTMTSASGRRRSKATRRRKLIRKALMVVFPIVSVAFLIWAYQDWLQCTIGHGEDSDEGNRCGRGNGGGHGKLPPSPRPPTGDDDSDLMSVMMGGKKHKKHQPEDDKTGFYYTILPLLLGWGSAVLYLGSRIPQIYKNWRLKSCEGLSIMMFMFSVFGNVFYVASIFLNSLEIDYLIKNMPWWLGSGGTLIFDFTVSDLQFSRMISLFHPYSSQPT